ncbi:F0F1 ATP synthase subunit B/delta [Williamsia sterculiae]|uniref:Multifunctional fusion protein n=1 Tax=Williamsia sterculiae TaxID=1344003 RepID=A0A1N7E2S1_9NOCA|nr:F0F1 ATP synthase subunit B/delta [Williamsia sterculiae]SIR82360.1 F-type H+-transporting ATPase subunit delta [Williamsia sterculiae]
MGIFIGQLVGFLLILFVLWKYVLPPLNKAVEQRQNTVSSQMSESEAAKKRLDEARNAYDKAMSDARAESARIREEARGDADAISEEMRVQADHEVQRITEHGKSQVALNRSALVRELRAGLGLTAIELAGKRVREHLDDPGAKSDSVDRVIADLEHMADQGSDRSQISRPSDKVGVNSMRAASREAMRRLQQDFDEKSRSLGEDELTGVGEDLTKVVDLLAGEPVLRKHLAEPSDDTEGKKHLVHRLFDQQISGPAADLLATAASGKWSSTRDFTVGIERVARFALLKIADDQGKIDEVEDQLFRFGRVLSAQPRLTQLLSDSSAPIDSRLGLLDTLVGGKVDDITKKLLDQSIRLLQGRSAESAVNDLAELAAARRGQSVAKVVSAEGLDDGQRDRLKTVLGRIYGRDISLQTEKNPEILGGLRISVGDEVIDADIATRLAKASEQLPR